MYIRVVQQAQSLLVIRDSFTDKEIIILENNAQNKVADTHLPDE